MFTGIVKYLGVVKSAKFEQDVFKLKVSCKNLLNAELGSSIMVNGACLTLASLDADLLNFDVIAESVQKTNLGLLKDGDLVNLEASLTLETGIDGHLVTGHIDFTTKLININDLNEYFFELNSEYAKYVVLKGSICINGVSLTVSNVDKDSFKVSLIPTTLNSTNLKFLQVGEFVNVEIDLIARYLEKLIKN